MQLYKESDITLVGNVTSVEITPSSIYTFYHIKVEQYLESTANDTITVVGSGPNGSHPPPDPKFMVGDRVRLYLYNEDGMHMISVYSTKANPKCYAHELLGLGPKESIPRGGNDQNFSQINCGPPYQFSSYPHTTYLPPTVQFKLGVKPQDVACNNGLQLLIRSMDNSPACVSPQTAIKIGQRSWSAGSSSGFTSKTQSTLATNLTNSRVTKGIIPKNIESNPQLKLQPQVAKVILGVNNTVVWINLSDKIITIQSYTPFSTNSFRTIIYPQKSFYFTFNQTGDYPYYLMGVVQKQGKIIVTTTEFEQSNLERPRLLLGGPENIVKMLIDTTDDHLLGNDDFTLQQVFPTQKGKIALGDEIYNYLPIEYTLNEPIVPLTETNAMNFTKEFLTKLGFVLDGTEEFDAKNFGNVIDVSAFQTDNYRIDSHNAFFGFSNDTTIISFGYWHNNISQQKLLRSTDAVNLAKLYFVQEVQRNPYLNTTKFKFKPDGVKLDVIDDKLMWIVSENHNMAVGSQAINVFVDIHSGKVFGWRITPLTID